jgi:hypothetical protein
MKPLLAIIAALSCIQAAHGAISFTAVPTYDAATNANAVESSGTALDVATFTTRMADAFTAGKGGVINFDNGTGAAPNWIFNYGSGSSVGVTVTGGQLNMNATDAAAIRATPISGNSYYRLGLSTTTLVFDTPLSEFGFTLLARSSARTLTSIVITLTDNSSFTLAGSSSVALPANTITSSSNYLTESGSGPDRFFGYVDTSSLGIKQIVINGSENLVMDDFGFVAVPEPSIAALAFAGATIAAARRRRA